jgi:hypothetical protein
MLGMTIFLSIVVPRRNPLDGNEVWVGLCLRNKVRLVGPKLSTPLHRDEAWPVQFAESRQPCGNESQSLTRSTRA